MLTCGMVFLGMAASALMVGFVTFCDRLQVKSMNLLALALSIAAMIYLVYAMLRPERF